LLSYNLITRTSEKANKIQILMKTTIMSIIFIIIQLQIHSIIVKMTNYKCLSDLLLWKLYTFSVVSSIVNEHKKIHCFIMMMQTWCRLKKCFNLSKNRIFSLEQHACIFERCKHAWLKQKQPIQLNLSYHVG
jgi:hypothetical protein